MLRVIWFRVVTTITSVCRIFHLVEHWLLIMEMKSKNWWKLIPS